jgi:Mn2+/Fe2+ NRAMP family transporter
VDLGCHLAAHGSGANDVRADWHGYRGRVGQWPAQENATLGLHCFIVALLVANTINVGADLSGMADAAGLLTGWNSHLFVVAFGTIIAVVAVKFRYHQIAQVLKWLVLSLGAYVLTAFLARPDWAGVFRDTLVPRWPADRATWGMIVAILGTTISPYLFFWQAAQEVEEEKAKGRRMIVKRHGATTNELLNRKIDVGLGTFFSNAVMFFVILCCATTLHRHGITQITTTKEAAEALRPLAGPFATLLYTLGLIGVGCLAIPTLAGSAAYAFAETFNWSQGLDKPYKGAREFYVVLVDLARLRDRDGFSESFRRSRCYIGRRSSTVSWRRFSWSGFTSSQRTRNS